MHKLQEIVISQKIGQPYGIYSICSANEYVIAAALRQGLADNSHVLIESTANQVNQFGGYTGMTPKDFVKTVEKIADNVGFPKDKLILGGDHLGPLTWTEFTEDKAMENAKNLIESYVKAGFTKIHLDTSMKLKDDLEKVLPIDIVARRAANLAEVAEDAKGDREIVYIVGSEVPIPGGATEEHGEIEVTGVKDFEDSVEAFRKAFFDNGLEDAWNRVIGFVVQPGVEFGNNEIIPYDRKEAQELTTALKKYKQFVFEGHSTDYQSTESLTQMVEDGIAVLKVGPALTFALREALFSLENIEKEIMYNNEKPLSNLSDVIEQVMLDDPSHWWGHYSGNGTELRLQRRYSLSDRVRYYLNRPEVEESIEMLLDNLNERSDKISLGLKNQYLPETSGNNPKEWVLEHIKKAIIPYSKACQLYKDIQSY